MRILIFIFISAFICDSANAQQSSTGAEPVKKVAIASSNNQTVQFQVWGNCGMCKKTIEKAAKGVNGVQSANWNMDTHQFTLVFDAAQTGVDKVHQAIAASGYDTDVVKGNDEVYANLPGCCQYERQQ